MVKSETNKKKPTRMERIMYSAFGLSLIGGAVAVLGAPFSGARSRTGSRVPDVGAAGRA